MAGATLLTRSRQLPALTGGAPPWERAESPSDRASGRRSLCLNNGMPWPWAASDHIGRRESKKRASVEETNRRSRTSARWRGRASDPAHRARIPAWTGVPVLNTARAASRSRKSLETPLMVLRTSHSRCVWEAGPVAAGGHATEGQVLPSRRCAMSLNGYLCPEVPPRCTPGPRREPLRRVIDHQLAPIAERYRLVQRLPIRQGEISACPES